MPGLPRSVTARAIGGTGEVRFSAPLSDGGSPTTGYTARCASSNGGVTRQAQGPASPVNVPSLSRGKTYTCTVRATNIVGTGPASSPSSPFRVPVRRHVEAKSDEVPCDETINRARLA